MATCKECYEHGLSCTICQDPSHSNSRLCHNCQHWDDMTHMLRCRKELYIIIDDPEELHTILDPEESRTIFNPGMFDEHRPAGAYIAHRGLHIVWSEPVSKNLSFQTLDDLANVSSKKCILCRIVGDNIRGHFGATQLNGAAVKFAVWMPFPTPPYNAHMRSRASATAVHGQKEGDEPNSTQESDQKDSNATVGLSQQCVVPIFVSAKAADGEDILMMLTLELVLHFGGYGHGLRDVTIWDRSTINVEAIRAWLNDCHKNHGKTCNSMIAELSPPRSLRLVDTINWCVVTAPTSAGYLALSYVWALSGSLPAGHKPFQLERGNMSELENDNGLRTAGDRLPKLLADAIQLSADLGYRYLWVDRLCIVQDDDSDKRNQLQAMDAIYHAADLTIVALGDGSTPGLPGTSSRPRKVSLVNSPWHLRNREYNGQHICVEARNVHEFVERSRWNTRGWTYQERLLSRRHLFLTDVNFYLSCYKSRSVSEGCLEIKDGYEKGIKLLFAPITGWESEGCVVRYATAVRDYTKRELTYNSDILNAFAGISNVFSAKFKTAMLSGLPEKHLTQALLWHHRDGHTCRTRDLPDGPRVPSWSWAAWAGKTTYDYVSWSFGNQTYAMDATSGNDMGCLVHFNYSDPSSGTVRPLNEARNWFRNKISTREGDVLLSCVHSPSEADRNATITDEGRDLAKTMPGSLVFNTTVVLATLRMSKASSSTRGNLSHYVGVHFADRNVQWEDHYMYDPFLNTDCMAYERIAFDIIDGNGDQVGQTFPLWNSSDEVDGGSKKRSGDLRERLKSGQKYTVAVVAACHSDRRFSSGDNSGLVVMVMDHDGDTGISRRLAIGAVDPEAWGRAKPTWETVVLA